jgi:nucleoside-diphosphate-sugar epimerase
MTTKGNVFLIGPGFIGQEVIGELIKDGYQVTALVRKEEAATELQKKGVKTILGTLEDRSLISENAAKADIVIHTASADHLPSVEDVLEGISRRSKDGKKTIYIHTSGCSEITDKSNGKYAGGTIYEDDKPEAIDALPDSAPHRSIDLAILKRRKELAPHAKISIVLPPLIYGVGKASGRISIQIPTMVRFAIKHGWAGYIGGGQSVWNQVHVSDLARGYLMVLHWMESSSPEKVLENPYWFTENGEELSWASCAATIGKGLQKAGKVQDPTPREIPTDLYKDIFGEWSMPVVGQNSRSRANRLRALGWKTIEKSTFESLLEDEIPILLKEEGEYTGYAAPVAS